MTPPPLPRFVAYYRVSTDRQERSGLGLDAQREAVAGQVHRAAGDIVADYTEIESGMSLRAVTRELDRSGVPTARGGTWQAVTVRAVLMRTGRVVSGGTISV